MTFFLGLDIETVPQPWALDPERVQPTDWWVEQNPGAAVMEAIEAGNVPLKQTGQLAACHPTTCRVVQVSLGWRNASGQIGSKVIQWDDYGALAVGEQDHLPERYVLSNALDMLAGALKKRTRLVTFNGKGFDLPILRWRASLLGMCDLPPIPWRKLLYPYSDEQHCDLRLAFGNDDRRATGTLQTWADAFGIHAEEHGAEVGAWVAAGEWDQLRRYGEVEQVTLVELYERVLGLL